MIYSVKSNIFEVTGESVLTLYGTNVVGAPTSSLLVVTKKPLSPPAMSALEKSAASLEFGTAPLAVAVVETDEGTLGSEDVRTIVEGLDPVALVVADALAAELVSAAYRTPLLIDERSRLLGRTAVVFQNFEALMESPESKQKAWALLKKLR